MATNQELREQINQKQAEIKDLERQIEAQTPSDGVWNPADYVQKRWNTQKNSFTKNWDKIPAEAQQYIQEQIYKRKQSGVPLNKWFLRTLENYVKGYFEGVPDNWDISSWLSRDSKMAEWINKNDNNGTVETKEAGYTRPTDPVKQAPERTAHEEEKFNEYKERYGEQDTADTNEATVDAGAARQPTAHEEEKFEEYKKRYGNEGNKGTDTQSTPDTSDIQKGVMSSDFKAKAREQAEQAASKAATENPERANEIRERTKQAESDLKEKTVDHSLDADKAEYPYSADGTPVVTTDKKAETPEQKQSNDSPVFEQKSDAFEVPQQDKPGNAAPIKPDFEYSADGPSNTMDMALDMSVPVAETDKKDIFDDMEALPSLIDKIPDYDDKLTARGYLNRIKYAQAELDRAEAMGYEEGVISSTEQDLRLHKKYLQELLKRYNLVQE